MQEKENVISFCFGWNVDRQHLPWRATQAAAAAAAAAADPDVDGLA
jgi:hypothetical protein